ncbi:amidohydrolase [Aspergillus steynii IBT 23096]|uniref:Amidohydrolase n=1 Tax=Aspergillus steynii IBT 23096 TaxID=1392250 RepID=A0A2I2FWQ8_9EURO|nr:amidohydrolase [Aspergillus steynii IBT 23096]PLB45058.1 amidohydrolase [Aspergillus steynii IBT 23096]
MSPTADSILLRNGTILQHEGQEVRSLKECDLLIEGDKITGIGQNLAPPTGCKEVDCTSKIISPGFINGHHHLWQSQLKGRHGDQGFMEYMASGNLQSYNYRPDDIFWGQLGGCLQSIDGGVTTVVDHAHMTYSPQHATEAIRASASSGIRSVFCYTLIRRIREWSSTVEFEEEFLPEWWLQTLESLAGAAPVGNGRVTLGLAVDPGVPVDILARLWEKAQALGLKLVTMHYVAGLMKNAVQLLSENNQLTSNVLISHGNGISTEDAQTLINHDIFICSTPETEMQMGLGNPVAFRHDLKSHTCIGTDCHANNSADILTQMRLGLQHTRAVSNDEAFRKGEYPSVDITLEQAFNLGTIQGAKAIRMEDQIGSLVVGKKADILIFDASSPSMVCAAEENPLAAVMLHASVRDIETVIVDGKVVKERGVLKPVEIQRTLDTADTTLLDWSEVSQQLLQSRERVLERAEGQDVSAGMAALMGGSH